MNKSILLGRLTRDPELRQTASGTAVAGFSVAVNRRFKNADGEYETDFINCTAWRQTAEFVCKYFQKGSMIAVVGSIQNQKYTDKDGNERTATGVVADEVYFAGSKGNSESRPADGTPPEFNTDFAEFVPDEDEDNDLPF